jgi:hypothetical protein
MTSAIGWKAQSAQGTAATGAFYWHRAVECSFQPIELVQAFPPELGGTLLPAGLYKGGYWVGGALNLVPRVDQNIGWLLWSFAGTGAAPTGSGPYVHVFPGQNDAAVPNKWLTFHRMIPKSSGTYYGEEYVDCKVTDLVLNAVPGSVLNLRANVLGISATPSDDLSGHTSGWAPLSDNSGYEVYSGAPIATCAGLPILGGICPSGVNSVTITASNNIPDPRTMLVLGSYAPMDYPVLQRTVTVETNLFWQDATIVKNIRYGGGSSWTPALYTSYSPFDVSFVTPGNLAGGAYVGTLGFWAASGAITWQVRSVDTRGGDVVVMRLLGTVNSLSSGQEWRFYLKNAKNSQYT